MIKGILLDSGRVLNDAKSGHWFISPDFFQYVNQGKFNQLKKYEVRDAFLKALMYMDTKVLVKTIEEELMHFIEFYRIFLEALPVLKEGDNQHEKLAKALVYNPKKYVFYKDVKPFIKQVKHHYKLAVVSDAWPSLEDVFIAADYRTCFDAFVISSYLGVCKPNSMMYNQALTDLNLVAEEAIFVDDRPKNCLGAEKLGIKSILLCRDFSNYLIYKVKYPNLTVVRNLKHVERILRRLNG